MKSTYSNKLRHAAFTNKQNSPYPKRSPFAAGRFAAVLCVPLLLLPATITPAYAATAAQQPDSSSPAEQTALKLSAPYFKALPNSADRSSLGVSYYGESGSDLQVTGRSGELLEARTPFGEPVYVPAWYTTHPAGDARKVEPLILRLKPDASLHLFPDSTSAWPAEYASSGAVSAVRYDDWYGIALPAEPGYANGSVVRPALLWVKKDQVQSTQTSVSGLLSPDSTVPTRMVRSLTETSLQIGTTQEEALTLLGEPYSRTPLAHSEGMTASGDDRRGERWRYERGDAQLTLSFGTDGTLLGWNWILPTSEAAQAGVNSDQPPYAFRYDFRTLPPVASASPETLWQTTSDLDAQYLLAASEQVLLVREDDGYAGGRHLQGGIYAIDRASGERLWSVDGGYGSADALISEDGQSALVLTGNDPEAEETATLRSIRLRDGAIRWSREAEHEAEASVGLFAAGSSAVLAAQPSPAEKGVLTVRSQRSGSIRWTKEFADPYVVLNQGSGDPYVLIRQGRWIQALDSRSGQAVWSLKADQDTLFDPLLNPVNAGGERLDLLAGNNGTRWVALGGEQVRLNTSTGEITGRYPIRANEQVDMPGGDYLLIRRAVDSAAYESGSLFETVLYDVKLQQEQWSIPGRADRPLLDQDRLFVLLNGIPAALSAADGQPLWKTETSEFALGGVRNSAQAGSFLRSEETLLLPYGPDLLAFDAETGKPLWRIDGVSTLYNEANARLVRDGVLTGDGQTIYIASANGSFTAISAEALRQATDNEE